MAGQTRHNLLSCQSCWFFIFPKFPTPKLLGENRFVGQPIGCPNLIEEKTNEFFLSSLLSLFQLGIINPKSELARLVSCYFLNKERTIPAIFKEQEQVDNVIRRLLDRGIPQDKISVLATLSARYISDRFLPDKAIDLVDEAAARLKMEITSKPEEQGRNRPQDSAARNKAAVAAKRKQRSIFENGWNDWKKNSLILKLSNGH